MNLPRHILCSVGAVVGLALCVSEGMLAQTPYQLTVSSDSFRQTFKGFGVYQPGNRSNVPEAARLTMYNQVFGGLPGLNTLHLYVPCDERCNNPPDDPLGVQYVLDNFSTNYIQDQVTPTPVRVIDSILAYGQVDTLLLTPCFYNNGAWNSGGPPTESADTYAERVAEVIFRLRQKPYDIRIDATGIANEPGLPPKFPLAFMTDCVRLLRQKLDTRGLKDVRVISTEASVNQTMSLYLDALYNDPVAWGGLHAIASHSYTLLETGNEESRKRGKEWWMDEMSMGQYDGEPEDEDAAAVLATHFLQALNHGVDRWMAFLGVGGMTNIAAQGQRRALNSYLAVYDFASGSTHLTLPYHYYKQILSTFDLGAVFRSVTSAAEGPMFADRVSKRCPSINAAAAQNPDGSWAVGIINSTGISSAAHGSYTHDAATTFAVSVTIPELVSVPSKEFTVYRSRANTHFINAGTMTFVNGIGSVNIASRELLCLRSGPQSPSSPPPPTALKAEPALNAPVRLTWNNSPNARNWIIERATVSGGPYSVLGYTAEPEFMDTTAAYGTTYYYAVTAYNGVGASARSAQLSHTPAPITWQNLDIGEVGMPGDGVNAGGVFTVTGAGQVHHASGDALHFMYVPLKSNGTFIAKLNSATGYGWRNGVMIRQTLDPMSTAAAVLYGDYVDKPYWYTRISPFASEGWENSASVVNLPVWLKLVRNGPQITGYYSADGVTWIPSGTGGTMTPTTYGMQPESYVGLSVCSVYPTQLSLATFSDVVTPIAGPARVNAKPGNGQIMLSWPLCFGATSYTVKRADSLDGPYVPLATVSGTSYTDSGLVNGRAYCYKVAAVNSANESDSPTTGLVPVAWNLASEAVTFEASVPNPTGGGNKNWNVIRDGMCPPVGNASSTWQFDSFTKVTPRIAEQYFGYTFNETKTFTKVVFQEGRHFSDGGWFVNGSLRIQVHRNGSWVDVPSRVSPPYPQETTLSAFGPSFEKYTFTLNQEQGDGVRIIGTVGGSNQFASVGELEAWGCPAVSTTPIQNSGTIIATVTQPTGGGNHTIGIIRDGDAWPVGDTSSTHQYDTYNGGVGPDEQYCGYTWPTQKSFTKVLFKEGKHFYDGGWLNWGSLRVQVRNNGQWENVPAQAIPSYPFSNKQADFGPSMESYGFILNDITGDGIRIIGITGGSARFLSVCELEVWAK